MIDDMKVELLEDGKLKFEITSPNEEFKTRADELIGKSYSVNIVVLDNVESALRHLEEELAYLDTQLSPVQKRLDQLTFDKELFGTLSDTIIKNGKTTIKKYKQLNLLVERYEEIEKLNGSKKFLEGQVTKINEQINLIKSKV